MLLLLLDVGGVSDLFSSRTSVNNNLDPLVLFESAVDLVLSLVFDSKRFERWALQSIRYQTTGATTNLYANQLYLPFIDAYINNCTVIADAHKNNYIAELFTLQAVLINRILQLLPPKNNPSALAAGIAYDAYNTLRSKISSMPCSQGEYGFMYQYLSNCVETKTLVFTQLPLPVGPPI
jgi:hypothetical protein